MAAEKLFPTEKPWEKMTQKERQMKLAADKKKKEQEEKAKKEKEARENPTVDANGEHI
jgi:membrane protein involved in colicin uptake